MPRALSSRSLRRWSGSGKVSRSTGNQGDLGAGHFHVCKESQSQGDHSNIAHKTVCL